MRSLIPLAAALVLACSEPTAAPAATRPGATTATATSAVATSVIAQPSPSVVATVRRSPAQPGATPNAGDERPVQLLVEFARAPSAATFTAIPFAGTVKLGLSDRIVTERTPSDLARPDAWELSARVFRGRYGPFSSLELLARAGPTTISVGPHLHCASPPVPPPQEFADARRLSIQPMGIDTCVLWWTVDLFVSPAGRIQAITLDLWDP